MDSNQISQLAREIAARTVADNLSYWSLLILLAVVAAGAGAWIGAYFGKRGEAKALKDGFEDVLKQLRETTSTVEKIRAEVQHDDWAARELKTLRRTRLEEFVALIDSTPAFLEKLRDYKIFDGTAFNDAQPEDRILAIGQLYFRELLTELLAHYERFGACQMLILRYHAQILGLDHPQKMALLRQFELDYREPLRTFYVAKVELVRRAIELLPVILGLPPVRPAATPISD